MLMDVTPLTRFRRFGVLSDEDRSLIEQTSTFRQVEVGRDLIRQGEVPQSVHFLLTGQAYRFTVLPGGRRQITALLIPGDSSNLQGCLSDRHASSVRTLTSCAVAEIPRRAVLDWIETRPAIARMFWRGMVADTAILHEWLVCAGARTAMERIAHLFCELLVRLRAVDLTTQNSFAFPLTQQELGEITGLSTVHVNRTLQSMRAEGLIVLRGDHLTIRDVHRLQEIAEFDSHYLDTTA